MLGSRSIMQKQMIHLLIFTDLDGTLLDHFSYSAKPADALIEQLTDAALADVIAVTSKTHAELLQLQSRIPLSSKAAVTENGSVVRLQDGEDVQTVVHGIEHDVILNHVAKLPSSLRKSVTGFSDMTADQVATATGLEIDDARRAKKREATEPFLWSGSESEFSEMESLLGKEGIRIQRGGRFFHFTGNATKDQAMLNMVESVSQQAPKAIVISIALGDGPNDLDMIEAADFGVIMPNPDGVSIASKRPNIRIAPYPGPKGWVVAVREIISELSLKLP